MDSLGAARIREQRHFTPQHSAQRLLRRLGACAQIPFVLGPFVVGCQAYEAAPLVLVDHMAGVGARLTAPLPSRGEPQSAEFNLTDGAGLAECEALALFYNPDLRLARERAGIARATADNAGLWQDPVFGFNGAQVLSPGDDVEFGAMLSVTLPLSGRLEAECDRADAAFEVQLRRIADAEWDVRADLRRTFFRWSSLDRQRELLEELLEEVSRVVDIADRLEAAGALGKAQSRLMRIEQVGRRAELMSVELDAELARLSVLALAGLAPDAAVALERPRLESLQAPDASTFEHIDETNTDLAILRASYGVAETSLRLAIRRQYPDLNLGLGPGSEDEDTRVILGLSLPLPLWNRNAQAIAEARAGRELARVAAEVGLERVTRDSERAAVTLRSIRRQREEIEGSLKPLLEDQAQTIAELAELGDVDAFLLLESLRRRYAAAARLLELEANEANATVELIRLVGPPANDTTGATGAAPETQQP